MHKNILVYPCGTEISFEIFNSLSSEKTITLFGANSVPGHADFLYKNIFTNAPFSGDEKLIDFLNDLISKNSIDFIYPAHDDALTYLSENRHRLKCAVLSCDTETVKISRSKVLTYKKLNKAKYLPFYSTNFTDFSSYPFFAKPCIGQGSFGTQKIESQSDLAKLNNFIDYVFCEYLPGEEFTIDCFTGLNNKLLFCNCRTRERIRNGISVRSKIVPITKEIKAIAYDINKKLKFYGAWFFQVKLDKNNHPKLMEVAPRIAGTMCVTRALGVNLPLLTVFLFCGLNIKILPNKYPVIADKCFSAKYNLSLDFEYIYLDFDDTLIINNNVNAFLLMFLYQCLNLNKKIILITKHQSNIIDDLNKFKISHNIFFKIITLKKDDEKYKFIKEKKSIFIDDSFSERKRVMEMCNINCFGLENIDALIDWRK